MCHDSFICDMSLTCVNTCSPHRSRQVRVACHIKLEFVCAVTHFTAHISSRHTHCIFYMHHQIEFMCAVTHLYMRLNSIIRDTLSSCVNTCSPRRAREALVAFYSRVFKSVWDSSLYLPHSQQVGARKIESRQIWTRVFKSVWDSSLDLPHMSQQVGARKIESRQI